jgi:hypothetical protein
MNLLASVQMPATPSASSATGHNNDLVDDMVEILPATPSASSATGHNNDLVDDLDDLASKNQDQLLQPPRLVPQHH